MADPIETGEVRATENHHHTSAHPAVLDKTDARQGTRQKLNMRVLVISMAFLAFAGVAFYLFVY